MTDPDQPFRRQKVAHPPTHIEAATPEENHAPATGVEGEPLILDPELHQSVWKPWLDAAGSRPAPSDIDTEAATVIRRSRGWTRRVFIGLAAVGVLVLVSPVVTPPSLQTPPVRPTPLLEDISTTPGITWSAPSGRQVCNTGPDEDHVILVQPAKVYTEASRNPSESSRLWSLDLRTGSTQWSVDLPGRWGFTCLPDADVVAATELEGDDSHDVGHVRLLLGSTGSALGELRGDPGLQVIPMGPNIGLVDTDNMLRVVRPEQLDAPLWGRRLPGSPGDIGQIFVSDIDDTTVQLSYSATTGEEAGQQFMPVYSVIDGKTPPWSRGTATDQFRYTRLGNVLLWYHMHNDTPKASILNLKGRILWELADLTPIIAGSRLYVASSLPTGPGFGYQELREVDPLTGIPVNNDVLEGQFSFVIPAPQGHMAIFTTDSQDASSLTILDDHLQPQGSVPVLGYNTTYEGNTWLYVRSTIFEGVSASRTRLSAIDPNGSHVLWTFDLEPTQHIEQLGKHLVIADSLRNTIQGLSGT